MKIKASWVARELQASAEYEEMSGRDSLAHLQSHDERFLALEPELLLGPAEGDRAGSAVEARLRLPRGLALHPDGYVLMADTANSCVKLLSVNMREVQTLVSAADGLHEPVAITVCPQSKDIFISDAARNCIFRRSANGVVTRFSGPENGEPGYQEAKDVAFARWRSPGGLVVDLAGDLLVCDRGNNCVRRIELSKDTVSPPTDLLAGHPEERGTTDGPLLAARFSEPADICLLHDGTIFVADSGSGRIREIAADGKEVKTLRLPLEEPAALDVDPCGRLYVADVAAGWVYRYDRTGHGSLSRLCQLPAKGLVIDPRAGLLFVTHACAVTLVRVVPTLAFDQAASVDYLSDLLAQENATEYFSDVTFAVEGKTFHGHQAVLGGRCPKLRGMFKRHGGTDEPLDIPGVSYAAFLVVMTFLYTDRCILDSDAPVVLQLADEWDLTRLKRVVEEYLLKRLIEENALQTLKLAHNAHAPRLKQAALRMVHRRPKLLDGLQQVEFPSELLQEVLTSLPMPELMCGR